MTFEEIINNNKPVLVDFFAEWCGPCKMMPPILRELKGKIGDEAIIVKVDVDINQSVAAEYQIRSVPTLMLFKAGKPLWRKSGVLSAGELEKVIRQYNV